MEKKTNKAKLEIFKFLRKSAESQWKLQNPTVFMKTQKMIENYSFLLIVWDFHWNSWADCHKKSQNIIFRWKRRQIKKN